MSPVRSDLEDFAPIVDATRRGAHRARPSVVSEVLPAVSVVLVIAVVTAVVLIVLGGGGSNSKSGDTAAASTAVTPSASASPSASEQASPEPTPSQEPETSPTEEPAAGDVDKGIKYAVLNDTDTSGLAKKAATKLKSAGWTATPTTGNTSPKGRYDTSVVYFKSDDDEASAKQIAADLGISEVTKSSTKSKSAPVTVVLGKDYQP